MWTDSFGDNLEWFKAVKIGWFETSVSENHEIDGAEESQSDGQSTQICG